MAKAAQNELDRLQGEVDAATKANDQTKIAAAKKALTDAKARQ